MQLDPQTPAPAQDEATAEDVLQLPNRDWVESLGRRPEIIPDSGWLPRYVEYAQRCTDAPAIYHMAVGLAVISTVLGNRCWLRLYGGKTFAASWHVLLGESSYMRKSTAMRIGLNLLTSMEGADAPGPDESFHANQKRGVVLPSTFSKEGLEQALQGRGDGVMPVWEFGELLAMFGKDYMAGTKDQLTRWWDGDSTTRATVTAGTKQVKDPAVTIIGASTPAWLEDRVKEGDIMGGFLARFNFWPAQVEDKGPWKSPLDSHTEPGQFNALATSLSLMRAHREEFTFDAGAKSRFEDWLRRHEDSLHGSNFPRQLMGFHGRISTSALKMAMVLEAATEERSMVIREKSMLAALKVAEWLKGNLAALFTEELAYTPFAQDQRKVQKILAGGPVQRRDLMRRLKMPVRQFNEVIEALIESERITSLQGDGSGRGRPATTYQLVTGAG